MPPFDDFAGKLAERVALLAGDKSPWDDLPPPPADADPADFVRLLGRLRYDGSYLDDVGRLDGILRTRLASRADAGLGLDAVVRRVLDALADALERSPVDRPQPAIASAWFGAGVVATYPTAAPVGGPPVPVFVAFPDALPAGHWVRTAFPDLPRADGWRDGRPLIVLGAGAQRDVAARGNLPDLRWVPRRVYLLADVRRLTGAKLDQQRDAWEYEDQERARRDARDLAARHAADPQAALRQRIDALERQLRETKGVTQ